MLSAEKNKILTEVGPGTPMGDYLRRYWMPIGGASELDANPIKAIRLLGEDLVLYKDLGGRYGLRRPALSASARRPLLRHGRGDRHPLQLSRLVDGRGAVASSSSPTTTSSIRGRGKRCTAKAYPVKECAGLLFAYMGPQPAPELPIWEPFTWENGFREVVLSDIPCNWFQCQENSCDPVHFEWMHENWDTRLNGEGGALCRQAPQARVRGVRLRLRLQARARGPAARAIRSGPSAASRYGRTASISAITSNGACRSTTRTRSASAGSSCACRRGASPMCRTRSRPGSARSRTRTGAGSRATSSTRTSSPGSGRA